jgi:PAS domain S-box-containing protein
MVPVTATGKRVLVVEDQRLIAADIENTLGKLGYVAVGSVASGEEAIPKAAQVRPDLVLMDIHLRGELDGIQTAELMRDRFGIPIVFLTAYADEETVTRAKGATPFGYLVKPFNERELRAAIEVAIHKHEMDRLLAEERKARLQEVERVRRLQVLTETVRAFAEASSDYEHLLEVVARTLGQVIKDGCIVRLATDDGWLEAVAIHPPLEAHIRDPQLAARVRAHTWAPHHIREQRIARAVFETGAPILVPRLDMEQVRATATPEIVETYEAIGIHSLLLVALRADGKTIGVLALVRFAADSPPFTEDDRDLAQALADHAAMAITSARLLQRIQALLVQERAARRAGEELKLFVDGVRDYAIVLLTTEGIVSSWNLGAERITGYSANEIIGRHFSVFSSPEDVASGAPARQLEIAAREGRSEEESWRLRKDGSRFWASVVTTAVRDADGRLYGFGKVTRDLTERKRMEDRLLESVVVRDEFLQIASHELGTPLTALQLQLDTVAVRLEATGVGDQGLVAGVATASQQAARLQQLAGSLVDVSRITAGRLRLSLERCDLCELVRGAVDGLAREAAAAGSEIRVVPCDRMVGQWDRQQIQQAIWSLLSNAIKYGLRRPITVAVQRAGGLIGISVRDEGLGIAPDDLDRIFGRFERAVSMHHYGGLGLGLYMSRQIAEAHGGTVAVQSHPDRGSTFTLVLPDQPQGELDVAPDGPASGAAERGPDAAGDATPRSVLLVDDDVDLREILGEALVASGFTTASAANGREALDRLAAGLRPDLILLDMMMPVMNGRAFRAEQLTRPDIASIPVLLFSAFDLPPDTVEELHAARILRKPVGLAELLEAMDAV